MKFFFCSRVTTNHTSKCKLVGTAAIVGDLGSAFFVIGAVLEKKSVFCDIFSISKLCRSSTSALGVNRDARLESLASAVFNNGPHVIHKQLH